MKKTLLRIAFFVLSCGIVSSAVAQIATSVRSGIKSAAKSSYRGDAQVVPIAPSSGGFPSWPISLSVTVPGADTLPIWGHLQQQQSDGRALHNIQVDPINPMRVHAVIMEDTTTNPKDTNLFGRRLLYTFSSDGGNTWKIPDTLGSYTRTGFACMILYQRNGVYVPIIAGHRYLSNKTTSLVESVIWIEQGNPGDGNFAMTECGTTDADGVDNDILWPYIGISQDNSTIYIIGSEDFTSAPLSSYFLQYGTFSLDETGKAVFNGWSQDIGSTNSNDANAGWVQTGDYVLRVSPKGKVGILWRETDYNTPSTNLYFIESTDGGKTFDSSFEPIMQLGSVTSPANGYLGPWVGLDFFYAGENAKLLWTNAVQSFDNDTNTYYPSEIAIHIYDVGSGDDYAAVSTIVGDTSQNDFSGNIAEDLVGTQISETDDWLAYPTIAQTSDSNVFSIYYQTFIDGDSVQFNATTYKLYGSIYSQTTMDGGKTWSAPTAYQANSGPPDTYGKIDFRWPQVSDWNPEAGGGVEATVMFAADSAAGANATNGGTDWDVINFFHGQVLLSGVSNSTSPQSALGIDDNFPNPFATSTNINFTLPDESNVQLTVEDVLGRTIETLVNGPLGPGDHSFTFNAGDLPNGIYSYTLRADGQSVTKSMSLIR